MIRIAINGAAGRMGRRLVELVSNQKDMKVAAALELAKHPDLGRDIGLLAGCGELGVPLTADWSAPADVLIDFTTPDGTILRLSQAVRKRAAACIGTTGLSASQKAAVKVASKKIPILFAPNMSVGVNLLFKIAGEVAAALGSDYDIEIVEAHHRFKKDAPSGTALRIADEIADATGRNLARDAVYGRKGPASARKPGEIGIHAIRAGDIVGDHTVIFSTLGERVELTHRAHTRDTFALGAIRAARFLARAKPGMYSMQDVLK